MELTTTASYVHVISVDDVGGIVVTDEKALLTEELIKHYTATWDSHATENRAAGHDYDLLQDISVLLTSLSISHCIFTSTSEMKVLEPEEDEDSCPPYDEEPESEEAQL